MKTCKNCRLWLEHESMTWWIRALNDRGIKSLTKENYPHCYDCDGIENWESRFPWMRRKKRKVVE